MSPDFEIGDAPRKLNEPGLCKKNEKGQEIWQAPSLNAASGRLDEIWDNYFRMQVEEVG